MFFSNKNLISFILFLFVSFFSPTPLDASSVFPSDNSENTYKNWNHVTISPCPDPTPTYQPTLTPSITIIPTASPTCTRPTSTITTVPTSIPSTPPSPTTVPHITPTPSPQITPQFTPSLTPNPTPTSAPDTTNHNNSSSPPVCGDSVPSTPQNLQAVALGGGKVKLTWNAISGSVTGYAVAYGPSVGNYLYGDPNVGNVTSYIVQSLNPASNYCFYVQAQNGCRGGNPSNVVCTNQPTSNPIRVLGVTDNYNPIVVGIRESFGGSVIGISNQLANTAATTSSPDKLPSGNTLDINHTISIPSLNLVQNVYLPQLIGDQLTVGHHEVLSTTLNNTQLYYAHNATDVFGTLYKINLGDQVIVTRDGISHVYQVTQKDFVAQENVAAVKTNSSDKIVLMTCSYTHPDHRILVTASLLNK